MSTRPSTQTPVSTADQVRRWAPLAVVAVAFIYSLVEVISLAVRHNDGQRISAVLVAAIATLAGAISLWLTWANRRRTAIAALALVLWIGVGIGGIAGSMLHIANSVPTQMLAAPLGFTLAAILAGVALFYDQFMRLRPRY